MKYLNTMAFVSSAGGDVAGFGGDASESEEDSLGVPKDGDTKVVVSVGVDRVDLNVVLRAEGGEVDAGGDWAVKVNGLDAEVPAPKPTNPANLG